MTISSELSVVTIEKLIQSDGIGFPMATTILKFIRPDIYPIIDIRAYRALYGKKISYSQYSITKYIDYSKKIYTIAKQLKLPLKNIDEQLYKFDKVKNGKI